jgi:hypothetical protein
LRRSCRQDRCGTKAICGRFSSPWLTWTASYTTKIQRSPPWLGEGSNG